MFSSKIPLVSIVIPTRNEAEDISETLKCCISIEYENKEIIVVDDSTDGTPSIVDSFARQGVSLIHREFNSNGCCGARNLGMASARGEIIVLFNADDRPEKDFIKRILVHYENGADYLIVRSTVMNLSAPTARFTYAEGKVIKDDDPEWSEGFSCRKLAVETVGYIPGNFPLPFCRDYLLGITLHKAGYKKVVDYTIHVKHIVPATLKSYWYNQMWRGSFSALYSYFFRNIPIGIIWVREGLKLGRTLLYYLLIIPPILKSFQLSSYSQRRFKDIFLFLIVGVVRDIAQRVGNISGLVKITKFDFNK